MNWDELFKTETEKDYFHDIVGFVTNDAKEHEVFPKRKDLFRAYKLCPPDKIKVVILGQDPYPNVGQAHGLSFSAPKGCLLPASLRNIYKEIKNDIGPDTMLNHSCLTGWAKQGVFLLNSILTVRKGDSGSHKKAGWETFTDATIKLVNDIDRPIVFMLWGLFAKGKKPLITNPKHLLLEAVHPSPYSAHNFFGCKHFSKANEFLVENGINPIDWSIK